MDRIKTIPRSSKLTFEQVRQLILWAKIGLEKVQGSAGWFTLEEILKPNEKNN